MKNLLSKKLSDKLFNGLILLIGSTFFINKLSTILIIVFFVFCLLFKRQFIFTKTSFYIGVVIASLFLVELFFLWNNSDIRLGFKSLEKYLSLLLFPLLILGNYKDVKVKFILLNYARITLGVTLLFFIRFIFVYSDNVELYLQGQHLWEAGYVLVDSFGNHAPNVSLHLAFVTAIILYYFISDYDKSKGFRKILDIMSIVVLMMLVFIINTRVALVLMFLDCFLVLVYFIKEKKIFISRVTQTVFLIFFVLMIISSIVIVVKVPYYKEKFSTVTFGYMDKIGKLDEIEKPEAKVYNSLALRLSVWKSVLEVYAENNMIIGVGASDFDKLLFEKYEETNQVFLRKYELGPHNQYIESLVKFGVVGIFALIAYVFLPFILGIKINSILMIVFSINLILANFFDGYLFLFMGIVYSGWMISIFGAFYLQVKEKIIT